MTLVAAREALTPHEAIRQGLLHGEHGREKVTTLGASQGVVGEKREPRESLESATCATSVPRTRNGYPVRCHGRNNLGQEVSLTVREHGHS